VATTVLDAPPAASDVDRYLEYGDAITTAHTSVEDLLAVANSVNQAWDQRETSYESIHTILVGLEDQLGELQDLMAGLLPPPGFEAKHREVSDLVDGLLVGADGMIKGLEAPDDGSARREALAGFGGAAQAIMTTLDEVESDLGVRVQPTNPEEDPTTTTSAPATTAPEPIAQSQARSDLGAGAWLLAAVVGAGAYALGRRERSNT
jgi:hypothetical protein